MEETPPEAAPPDTAPAEPENDAETAEEGGFHVHLDNFDGPFDLLLGLISKHKLDITEVSLHKVTDDFIAHIRSHGKDWDLDQASHFLLIAATLLDLKCARLLPSGEVDDEEDLALLEARDLLFARLLQYRAYKEVAGVLAARIAEHGRRHPRLVPMEARFANLLPEVLLGLGPDEFARLAARAMTPKAPPSVSVEHMYQPKASVKEQAEIVVAMLRRLRDTTFRVLAADAEGTYEVVARFLALLELYREQAVAFRQDEPLGELHVAWTGTDDGDVAVGDDYEGAPKPAEKGDGEDPGEDEGPGDGTGDRDDDEGGR
ncbi:segregation and condensation protein A [Actinomadura algeriensis]|uniref:Segregation and condensation protein A n=1 Tax=Actinomadura algeriensis TaxID=1679523 RepID=A0ABR9JYH9_9ACTN|nr:segregation and condensation protein A [Actinomadura algeriensis]